MNTVKQDKSFRKWKTYYQQLFLTVLRLIFPLNCQIYCRCLFWKLNHEWTLKHVLDKELLIYRTTDRRQVGHWTLKGFIYLDKASYHTHQFTQVDKWRKMYREVSITCKKLWYSFFFQNTGFKGIARLFGKYAYLLSWRELDFTDATML